MINKEVIAKTNEYLGMTFGKNNFSAHRNLWDAYEQEKSKKLFELFGENNYIIEKRVEINKDYYLLKKEFEESSLRDELMEALYPEFKELLNTWIPCNWSESDNSPTNKKYYASRAAGLVISSETLARQTFREDFSFYHPVTDKLIKLQKGAKVTKAWKHFIADEKELARLQTLYSQITNTKTLKGTLCLSIHPLDYLTVSTNKSGWSSCFDTYDKGEWCASTLSLITSPNTMVAYLKADQDVEYGGVEWNNKRWRAYVSIADSGELIHIGRNYPYESNPLMEEIMKMFSEISGKNFCKLRNDYHVVNVETPENMYNDASCGCLNVAFTEVWEQWQQIKTEADIYISDIGAICPVCGDQYSDCEFDIACGSCTDMGEHCGECGGTISPNSGYFVPSEDYEVCEHCYDNYYCTCEECHDTVHADVVVRVATSIANNPTWSGDKYYYDYMCEGCLQDMDTHGCEGCGETFASDIWDEGETHCRNCREKKED